MRIDAGAYKFVCRIDPRCGKKFVRGDLLTRHEERHQNRKNKQGMSEDGHSPPTRIAPSPTGSPTSELANNFTRAINIPMSSPDNDYEYARSDGDDRSPLSSPDEMSVDPGYPYHSPTPNRQAFVPVPNYNGNNQSYAPPVSTSPNNYGGGFVAINQQFPNNPVPVLDSSQTGYTFNSDPIAIPVPTGYSLPGQEPTNVFAAFFTSHDQNFLSEHQFVQENWTDLYDPNTTGALSFGNKSPPETWHENFDMQQVFSSQSGDGQGFDRRDSMYFPTV